MAFQDIRQDQMRSTDPEPGPSMDAFKRAVHIFRAKDDAVDMGVKGEKTSIGSLGVTLILLVITVAYVLFEASWNASFAATMYEGTANRDEINALVQEGRWLAAFGLAWALVKGIFMRESTTSAGFVVSVALVVGSTMLAYVGISRGYESAIDAIPEDKAALLYKASAHRAMVMSGVVEDSATQDPLAVTLWALKVLDQDLLKTIDDGFEAQTEETKTKLIDQVVQEWPKIQSQLAQAASLPVMTKLFDEGYATYLQKSRMTLSHVKGWQQKREQEFVRLTGMKPNAKATKEQFAQQLLTSHLENYRALGRMYLQTKGGAGDMIVYQAGDMTVMLSEVTGIKTQEDLVGLVEQKFKDRVALALSAPELLKKAGARDAIAAAILPPVALLLSALAVLLNLGNVVGLLASRVPVIRALPQWIWPLGAVTAVLAWIPPVTSLPGLEGGFAWIRLASPGGSWLFERLLALEYLLITYAI